MSSQDACRESRSVSSALEKLCESMSHTVIGNQGSSPSSPLQLRTTKNSLVGLGVVTQVPSINYVDTLRGGGGIKMLMVADARGGGICNADVSNCTQNIHDFS